MDQPSEPDPPRPRFTPLEQRIVLALTALFGLRMLGYHLVLPVFAPYAKTMAGSTSFLIGLTVGAYGLTQTIFQVPYGSWSDRRGRRPVLTAGLAIFALGSVVCAMADTALLLIAGRLVQGMGAVASVIVATVADHTREEVRTRAMAWIGVALGASFALGLLVGPWATLRFGVPSLFWLMAALCLAGIAYLWLAVPEPPKLVHHDDLEYSRDRLGEVLFNRRLLVLDAGAFNLHVALTSIFVTAPFLLETLLGVENYWKLFVPLVALGLTTLLLGARLAEPAGRSRRVALAGQSLVVLAFVVLSFTAPATVYQPAAGLTALAAGILLFVAGFALLEPLLPALLTRLSGQANRGTAVGVFNMSQFGGAFVGGIASGLFLGRNVEALYWILAVTSALWLLAAFRLEDPRHLTVLPLPFPGLAAEDRRRVVRALLRLSGVEDVAWERGGDRLMIRYAREHVTAEEIRRAADGASDSGT